jgi:hypothetical protein
MMKIYAISNNISLNYVINFNFNIKIFFFLLILGEDLCLDLEARVCTLHDYISSDESDFNMSAEDRAFVRHQKKIICSLLKKIAPIRIYIIGNDENISNEWSELMIKNEPNNHGHTVPQYDQWCTFVENEPITSETVHKLVHRYSSSWQLTNITPVRLDTIRNDIHFLPAFDRSHTTLEAREMTANIELCLWAMNYHENSTKYSSEVERKKIGIFFKILFTLIVSHN